MVKNEITSIKTMKRYYFFYLEIALKAQGDNHIYAYENVSHIPTSKLIELFDIDTNKDPHLLDGYLLTEENYQKHKSFIKSFIGSINLNVFEYCLMQYVSDNFAEIRKLYKEDLME